MALCLRQKLVEFCFVRGRVTRGYKSRPTHQYIDGGRRYQNTSSGGGQDYQFQPGQTQMGPNTQKWGPEEEDKGSWRPTLFKMFENAVTTFASLTVLGLAGYGYHRYYKYLVLRKINNAFGPGDPVLDLASPAKETSDEPPADGDQHQHWFTRPEQEKIDSIVDGSAQGRYYLLIGEKGTGKSSMLIEAMLKVHGEGVSVFEAHADLEIFRIRLGKALDFEYHEDYIGSLFSIRGPRDTTALLDIERAFNKMEKVALSRRKKLGKPLVLIINGTHLLRNDQDGQNALELIQQRAEQWAASNLVTVVLNSDDYWVYERLKQHATRMQVIPVLDLPKDRALAALRSYRMRYFNEDLPRSTLEDVYDRIGGRLTFLNKVANSKNMLKTCDDIYQTEKTWFLNQCWILGEEMDDDVMDQQKFASAAVVMAKALVDKAKEMDKTYDPERGHILPEIPLHEARQIMTRADFIQQYDHINVFTIDSRAMVRADSVPMQNAFREICEQEGFEEHLEATLERISAIESLGRTREIVAKDLWNNGKYSVAVRTGKGLLDRSMTLEVMPGKPDDTEKK